MRDVKTTITMLKPSKSGLFQGHKSSGSFLVRVSDRIKSLDKDLIQSLRSTDEIDGRDISIVDLTFDKNRNNLLSYTVSFTDKSGLIQTIEKTLLGVIDGSNDGDFTSVHSIPNKPTAKSNVEILYEKGGGVIEK